MWVIKDIFSGMKDIEFLRHPVPRKAMYISIMPHGIQIHLKDAAFLTTAFGEFIFLTREEAEAKLKEREEPNGTD